MALILLTIIIVIILMIIITNERRKFILSCLRKKTNIFIELLSEKYDDKIINNIKNRYSGMESGNGTYVTDKSEITICTKGSNVNIIMYAVLHELAHIAYDEKNIESEHDSTFWSIYKFLVVNAVTMEIIQPDNYGNFCGFNIDYNVLYDKSIPIAKVRQRNQN